MFAAGQLSGGAELPPLGESRGSVLLIVRTSAAILVEVVEVVEVVGDGGVDGGKELKRLHLPEAEHSTFLSPERQVQVLDPIVCVLRRMLSGARAEFTQGCTVGAQPVGDDLLRPAVPTPQFPEELQCWLAILGLRHHAFEHLDLGIVGVPETVLNAVDLQEDLGKVLLSFRPDRTAEVRFLRISAAKKGLTGATGSGPLRG